MSSKNLEHQLLLNRPQNLFLENNNIKQHTPYNKNLEHAIVNNYFFDPNQNYTQPPIIEGFSNETDINAIKNQINKLDMAVKKLNNNDTGKKLANAIDKLTKRVVVLEKITNKNQTSINNIDAYFSG